MGIIFDTLEFSDDLTKIELSCHMDDEMSQAGYYICEVSIEYYKYRNVDGNPSDKAARLMPIHCTGEFDATGSNAIPIEWVNESTKLDKTSFEGDIYYVMIGVKTESQMVARGANDEEDEVDYYVGVILDWKTFYDIGMGYVVSMTRRCNKYACEIPAGFEQFILMWHAFQLAYEARDLEQLEFLWSRLMGQGNMDTKCNCG